MNARRKKASALALSSLLAAFVLFTSGGWFLGEFPSPRGPGEPAAAEKPVADERASAQVPLDLAFVDSEGHEVTLRELFDGTRPVILTMNYSNCPKLCSLQLNGLFHGLSKLDWNLGGKFQMVTVSIDPNETSKRAADTKAKYLTQYGREAAAAGWHFLTGREQDIRALADAVGFRYKYLPETKEYAHSAVTMICAPDGRVSRYFDGIEFPPQTLRMALLEAADGKIGTTFERVLMFCGHFDVATGRYQLAVTRILQAGGLGVLLVVGGVLLVYWRRENRGRRIVAPAEPDASPAGVER